MNPKQVVPIAATLAPTLAAIAPPLFFGAAVGLVLLALFRPKQRPEVEEPNEPTLPPPQPLPPPEPILPKLLKLKRRKITREDMAEVFEHGKWRLRRTQVVSKLVDLGFGKTAAYEALLPHGKFGQWLREEGDGQLSWLSSNPTGQKALQL